MSQGNLQNHPKMNQDLFKKLPSEIVIDILARLPVRTIISCTCVQNLWLHLVDTQEFVKSHFSKSAPWLIAFESPQEVYKLFEFEDVLDVERHDLHYKLVTKFCLTNVGALIGSVDGFLFLYNPSTWNTKYGALCICNPITRDYINLDCPQEFRYFYSEAIAYGFGSSQITSQYKVVRIFVGSIFNPETQKWQNSYEVECHVYTFGTGLWRRHASCALLGYQNLSMGVFYNGYLHWLVCDLDRCIRVSCFDLETEQFSTLSTPPFQSSSLDMLDLFLWGDCLGLCDNTSRDEIVIWSMKEYGVEKSWTKEIFINNVPLCDYESLKSHPIKVFKDGDILIQWHRLLFYYSNKTKTTQTVDTCHLYNDWHTAAFLHSPSFVSLKSFGLNVSSF